MQKKEEGGVPRQGCEKGDVSVTDVEDGEGVVTVEVGKGVSLHAEEGVTVQAVDSSKYKWNKNIHANTVAKLSYR